MKNKLGRACGISGKERYIQGWGNLRERDHWGDQDVDGRIILKWLLKKWDGAITD